MPTTRGKKPVSYKEEKDESDQDDASYDDESEDEKISKKSKKIKKAVKPKKTKVDKKDKKVSPAKTKDNKKKKAGKDEGKKHDSSDSEEKKSNPLLKKKPATKASSGGKQKGYNDSQFEKYQELLKDLSDWTNDQLKNALKKNEQSSTGTKKDLVIKVADGKVLGKIPRCPKCFGGRPRFDFKTGLYTCPGYRDDEDFKFCNKKYTVEELPRESWTD